MIKNPDVVIVDYGLGNLFSIKSACEFAGMRAEISSSIDHLQTASLVILPGVGAFAEAMRHLKQLDLIQPLKDLAASGKPMVGICLGMQLLMTESFEFGCHKGLGIIPGKVLPLKDELKHTTSKVPHIGWNKIEPSHSQLWQNSLLKNVPQNAMMYFVHSYYCQPADSQTILSKTNYGGFDFCSAVQLDNISAFQFHPERSGAEGLILYKNLAMRLANSVKE